MFNIQLLIILVGISIPGIISLIPSLTKLYYQLKQKQPQKKFPTLMRFRIFAIIQMLVFVLIASSVGITLSKKVEFAAPFLEELSKGQFSEALLSQQIYSGIFLGIPGAILFLIIYYGIIRKWLDKSTFEKINELRNSVGFLGRILYGGIVEEILFRWGVMTVIFWIGLKLNWQHNTVLWFSILLTGILFGICHLPSYWANGCQKNAKFIIATIGLNLYASVIFGWGFAQYGLCSAIIAHSVFHCLWYPLDKMLSKDEKSTDECFQMGTNEKNSRYRLLPTWNNQ